MSGRAKGAPSRVIFLKITVVRAAASGLNAEARRCNIPRSKTTPKGVATGLRRPGK